MRDLKIVGDDSEKAWLDSVRGSAIGYCNKANKIYFEHLDKCTKSQGKVTEEKLANQCNIFIQALFSNAVAITSQTLNISTELEDAVLDVVKENFKELRKKHILGK